MGENAVVYRVQRLRLGLHAALLAVLGYFALSGYNYDDLRRGNVHGRLAALLLLPPDDRVYAFQGCGVLLILLALCGVRYVIDPRALEVSDSGIKRFGIFRSRFGNWADLAGIDRRRVRGRQFIIFKFQPRNSAEVKVGIPSHLAVITHEALMAEIGTRIARGRPMEQSPAGDDHGQSRRPSTPPPAQQRTRPVFGRRGVIH